MAELLQFVDTAAEQAAGDFHVTHCVLDIGNPKGL